MDDSNEVLLHFRAKLQEAVSTTEANLRHWQKYDDDYATLQEFLEDSVKVTKKDVMVPFGPLAFMPGQLIHTNEVTVLLGDNWFAEQSVEQAVGIVERRREYTREQIHNFESSLADLNARLKLAPPAEGESWDQYRLENSRVDADGDEVNEEGLKFVEIREEYKEEQSSIKQKNNAVAAIVETVPETSLSLDNLGEFEKRLFAKIAEYEREEEEAGNQEDSEEGETDEEDDDSEGEARFEAMHDDDDDFNPESEALRPKSSSLRNRASEVTERPTPAKRVSFADDSKEEIPLIRSPADIYRQMSARSRGTLEQESSSAAEDARPILARPHRPPERTSMRDQVVEKEYVEQMSDSETDDYLFGREILNEYHRKRNQLIKAQTIEPLTPEEEYMAEQEKSEDKAAKVSRFRAARMAVREAVELPQTLERLAEPTSGKQTTSGEQSQIKFKPNIPTTSRPRRPVSENGPVTSRAELNTELTINAKSTVDTTDTAPRVSRFKASRMSAAGSSAESTPTGENRAEKGDMRVPPRVLSRQAAPPVVQKARPSMAASSAVQQSVEPTTTVNSSSHPEVAGKKISRFKAMRLGLNGGQTE